MGMEVPRVVPPADHQGKVLGDGHADFRIDGTERGPVQEVGLDRPFLGGAGERQDQAQASDENLSFHRLSSLLAGLAGTCFRGSLGDRNP